MPQTTSDKRVVVVSVTRDELTALLGAQAKAAFIIDFTPDSVEVVDNGDGFEVSFVKSTA